MVSMAIYDTDVRRIIMPKGPGTYGSQVGRPKKSKRKSLSENSERLYYESVGESVIDTYQRMGKLIMVNEVLPALLARGGAVIARGAAGIGRGVAGAAKGALNLDRRVARAAARGMRATGRAAARSGQRLARNVGRAVGDVEQIPGRVRRYGQSLGNEFSQGRKRGGGSRSGRAQSRNTGSGGEGRASPDELRGNPNRPTEPRNI